MSFVVSPSLARLLERTEAERQADYAIGFEELGGGQDTLFEIGGGVVVTLGANFPVNRGLGLGMLEPLQDMHLEVLERILNAKGLPAMLDLCPFVDPEAFAVLLRRGYGVQSVLNHYVLPLESYSPATIKEDVQTLEDETEWLRIALRAFEYGDDAAMHTLLQLGFRLPRASAFRIAHRGETIAIGAVQLNADVATLYGGGTIPEARGQGAQSALLHARLAAAQRAGCRYATSSATPKSSSGRNLERVGFRLAYTKLRLVKLQL
jgi:GNAT superfamily N-acetyltransferase